MIQKVPTPYSLPAAEDLQRDAAPHPRWAMLLVNDPDIVFVDCTREPAVERRNVTASHTMSGRIENNEPWGQHLPLGSFEIWVPAITDNEVAAPTASVSASWTIRNKYPLGPFEFSYQPVNPIFSDMSTEIAAGDLVVLKSGGPIMTAGKLTYKSAERIAVSEEPMIVETVECWWFVDNSTEDHLQSQWGLPAHAEFPASALKKV